MNDFLVYIVAPGGALAVLLWWARRDRACPATPEPHADWVDDPIDLDFHDGREKLRDALRTVRRSRRRGAKGEADDAVWLAELRQPRKDTPCE